MYSILLKTSINRGNRDRTFDLFIKGCKQQQPTTKKELMKIRNKRTLSKTELSICQWVILNSCLSLNLSSKCLEYINIYNCKFDKIIFHIKCNTKMQYRKSSIKPPSQISPLPLKSPPPHLFRGRKLIVFPLY